MCCMRVVFFKGENQLITGGRRFEKQYEGAQNKVLMLTDQYDALLLANGSLNNELTLTQQNIDVTQATISQLRTDKKKLETKLQQTAEEKQKLITADAELIQDRDLAKNTIVKLAATKEDLSKINAELETKLKGVLETVSELATAKEEYTSKTREMMKYKNNVITLKSEIEM